MMLLTLTSRTVSRSVPSQSVCSTSQPQPHRLPFAEWIHLELELDEEGTRISLTIVDTPGFGDQIDNEARCASLPATHLARPC